MEQKTLVAVTGHEIRNGRAYILVRLSDDDQFVVNVMRVVSKPTFYQAQNDTYFLAEGISVNGRAFSEQEGTPIWLTLSAIGAPKRRSPVGITCRCFPYGIGEQHEMVHRMLCKDVLLRPSIWHQRFQQDQVRHSYTIGPVFELQTSTSTSVVPF